MRKKLRNAILSSGIALSVMLTSFYGVSAAEMKVVENGNVMTVSAVVEPEAEIFLIVVKKGADITDNANVYAVCQAKSDADGKVTLTFEMPETMDGNEVYTMCDLYLKPSGCEELTYSFPFAPADKKDAAVEFVKGKLESGGTDADTFSQNGEYSIAYKAMGMSIDLLNDKNTSDFIGYFNGNVRANTLNRANLGASFNKALMMSKIKNGESVSECMPGTGYSFEGTEYKNLINETLKEWIEKYYLNSGSIATFGELDKSYITANALYLIDNARFDKIESLLGKYANDLGISTDSNYVAYKNMSAKGSANDKMVAYFKTTPCITREILINGIKASITKQPNNPGGSPTGPGGGGIISGGGKAPSAAGSENIPSKTTDKEQLKDLTTVPWASAAMANLYAKGIISGDQDGYFRPNNNINREEFIRMLVDTLGIYDKTAVCGFDDVSADKWFYPYVASAYKAGIISGISDTMFGSGEELTRQDMMVLIYRAYEEKFKNTKITKNPIDNEKISDYAQEAVLKMYSEGIVNGYDDGRIDPFGYSTKAQCAVILNNILSK